MSTNITSVKFRMYNTGSVGDCLLLLFQNDSGIAFKMLIDCGGWKTNAAAVTPCVTDIKKVCGGEIDLLIVTHQHEDHISGFNQARSVFDQITVKEVWMSWIEDKSDAIAKILKDKYGKKLKELAKSTELAIKKLGEQRINMTKGFGARIIAKEVTMTDALNMIKFEQGLSHGSHLAAGKKSNDDAMEYVRKKGKRMLYRTPGEVIDDIPGATGLKFYILGPPRDADMKYFKIDLEDDEIYHLAAANMQSSTDQLPSENIFSSETALEDSISPFGEEYKMNGKTKASFFKKYNSNEMKWRQIETDWLESSAAIAMRVNSLTNNTSLAMAIEFPSGKVMLLPGDAQSGNWMGWHKPDVMQKLKSKGGKDTNDLLRDTVFYKVGHHGSHNGTASKSGLDMMVDNKNLVALMPLVQNKVPKEWGGSKNFPASALYDVLIDKTKGRIIRTDEGVITKSNADKLRNQLTATQKKDFKQSFIQGDCYVEYTINVL